MYHVAIDEQTPYWIYSNRQDDVTMRGPVTAPVPVPNVPSYAAAQGLRPQRPGGGAFGLSRGAAGPSWQQGIGGCESGFTQPVPGNPDIVWSSCYGNEILGSTTGWARPVGEPLDSHADPSRTRQCPMPLDAAGSLRPGQRDGLLQLQVITQDERRGQTWSVIGRTSRPRTRASRRAGSSRTTWASSTARWCSQSRPRGCRRG
jgi:hypothetical protein